MATVDDLLVKLYPFCFETEKSACSVHISAHIEQVLFCFVHCSSSQILFISFRRNFVDVSERAFILEIENFDHIHELLKKKIV